MYLFYINKVFIYYNLYIISYIIIYILYLILYIYILYLNSINDIIFKLHLLLVE